MPKASLFAQGGYGKPGLNFLENEFKPWFIGGIRISWNIWDWNVSKNEKQMIGVRRQMVDVQERAFRQNMDLAFTGIESEITKLEKLMEKDNQIIELRGKLKKTASAQLNNGIITSTEYVTRLNEENQARLTRTLHEMQLIQQKVKYQTQQGR